MPVVVCVGLTTLDLVQEVEQLPVPNTKVTSDAMWYDAGGPAANAARVAAALGCEVRLVTALGASHFARVARDRLAGITVVDIARPEHLFPLSSVVLTGDGGRTVISHNAASLAGADLPSTEVLDGADVVLHDGHLLDASLALAGMPAPIHVLDGGSWKPGLKALLSRLDIAVVSADFALPGHSPDQALADLAGYGIPRLARTRGSEPVDVWVDGQVPTTIAVPKVDAVDTMGAGDVLHGALAAFLAQGSDFTSSMKRAVDVASRSVTGRGVLAGLRDTASDQA